MSPSSPSAAAGANASSGTVGAVAKGTPTGGMPVAAAALNTSHAMAQSASHGRYPFDPRVDPAVGKVFSLYYSDDWGKITSVQVMGGSYKPATRPQHVYQGAQMLPEPTCGLQLATTFQYPSPARKASLRLAELAVCGLLGTGSSLPSCGAGEHEVCELEVLAPVPSTPLEEPYIAAAIALVAYSEICSLNAGPYDGDQCKIHTSMSAVCAGFELGSSGGVQLTGVEMQDLLDRKLTDAYVYNLQNVYLAESGRDTYYRTQDYEKRGSVLGFDKTPPTIHFCADLHCLVEGLVYR